MAKLNPYMNFDNMQCREAMNFYKDCLGGELVIQKVSEMPEHPADVKKAQQGQGDRLQLPCCTIPYDRQE